MKFQTLVSGFVPAALLAPLVFAGSDASASQGLTRVGADDATPAAPTEPFDAVAWKNRLSERDLDARERSFEELARILPTSGDARRAVEGWSHDTREPELAWTSRLLLRDLRRIDGPRASAAPNGSRWNDLRSRMDDIERHFGGLGSMLDDMQRDMDRMFGAFPGGPGAALPPGASQRAQGYSLQMGPDGVKVEVDEMVDGKRETKTYTAKSLEELYAAHPELEDKVGVRAGSTPGRAFRLGGPSRAWLGDDDASGPFGRAFGGFGADDADAAPPTDRLGVYVDESGTIDRKALQLDDGVGLKVRGVQRGTMAARMGLEEGDVIVDVNGRVVRGVNDVRDALAQRKIDQDVVVTIVDGKAQRRTLTWRAAPAPAGAGEAQRSF